jgi:hypothetical protein
MSTVLAHRIRNDSYSGNEEQEEETTTSLSVPVVKSLKHSIGI